MFLILACILFVLWLLGVIVFKATKGFIHLLLIIAIVAIIVHFLRTPHA